MQLFDLLTVALLAAVLMAALARSARARTWAALLLAGALVSCGIHLVIEHHRWQMWPAYVVLAASLFVAARTWRKRRGGGMTERRGATIVLTVSGAFVLSLSVLASWAFPMFELPTPSGPHAIGTTQFHFVDSSRPEPHTANPVDVRELMVRVWYPATADASKKIAPYLPNAGKIAEAVNKDRWPFGLLLSHLDLVPTHALIDAAVATQASAYPVLVFSHGLGVGYAGQNTVLMEELASRGHVVFSVEHAYDGLASVFPDGRVATFMADAYEAKDAPPSAELERDAQLLMNSQNTPELLEILHRLIREQPNDMVLSRYWNDVWSKDQRFVFDQIEKLQRAELPSLLAGHLDVERMGVFGMSFGGSVAAITCAADSRCKAGMNIDGFRAVAIENPPQRSPFLYFSNGLVSLNVIFLDRDLNDRYFLQVQGSTHYDYTDIPYLARPVKLTSEGGTIDPRHMLALTNTYVGAFFDRYLAGKRTVVLEGPSADYPEAQLKARRASDGQSGGS